jgi:2'-5' RNA ligase
MIPKMTITIDNSKYIGKDAIGYLVNSDVSPEIKQKIYNLHHELKLAFGSAVWCQPLDSLHITLLDWLAPLVEYEKDKDVLFNEILPSYDEELSNLLSDQREIQVVINEVKVSQGAIFAVGVDNGEFENIRNSFINKIHLLKGTKQPPTIIHFSIARFIDEISLDEVNEFIQNQQIHMQLTVNSFRLIRESKVPMISYEIIKNYPLKHQ